MTTAHLQTNDKKTLKTITTHIDEFIKKGLGATNLPKEGIKAYKSFVAKPHAHRYLWYYPGLTAEKLKVIYVPSKKECSRGETTAFFESTAFYCNSVIAYKNKKIVEQIYDKTFDSLRDRIIRNAIPLEHMTAIRANVHLLTAIHTYIANSLTKLMGTRETAVDFVNSEYETHSDTELCNTLSKALPTVTTENYIRAAAAKDTVLKLAEKKSNKVPIIMYANNRLSTIDQFRPTNNELRSPGQVVQAIKSELVIEQKHWKNFLKLTASALDRSNEYISILLHTDQNKPTRYITKLTQGTTLINTLRSLKQAATTAHNSNEEEEAKQIAIQRHNTNYERLCHFITILHSVKMNIDDVNTFYQVRDVLDYLNATKEEAPDLLYPIHHTWNAYLKNTRTWHHARAREQAIRQLGNKLHTWNSLLPACEIDDYIITPLTDSPSLIAEGQSMHHCVGTYWRSAVDSNYRLFHIEHKENSRDIGTLCIAPKYSYSVYRRDAADPDDPTDNLVLNQLRGPYNCRVSDELDKVGKKILVRYRNIWKKTEARLRTWNRTVDTLTGEELIVKGFPDEDITLEPVNLEELDDAEQVEALNRENNYY